MYFYILVNTFVVNAGERSAFDREWRDKTQLASGRLHEEYRPRPHIGGESYD